MERLGHCLTADYKSAWTPNGGQRYPALRKFSTFYLAVSGKKRIFAVKLDVELNEWRMKQKMREYEASKMAYRDIKNSIDTAKQKGIEEGMNQKALDIARNMLADGVDINLIMKYSGLTQEQIEKLK